MVGKFLVDTNALIRLFRADEHLIELFNQAERVIIPAIVAGELYYGAQNSKLKQDNLEKLSVFLAEYEVIEVDLPIAKTYGEIKAQLKKDGFTIPENDLWIAATAKANQLTLISYDEHFSRIEGLQVIS